MIVFQASTRRTASPSARHQTSQSRKRTCTCVPNSRIEHLATVRLLILRIIIIVTLISIVVVYLLTTRLIYDVVSVTGVVSPTHSYILAHGVQTDDVMQTTGGGRRDAAQLPADVPASRLGNQLRPRQQPRWRVRTHVISDVATAL